MQIFLCQQKERTHVGSRVRKKMEKTVSQKQSFLHGNNAILLTAPQKNELQGRAIKNGQSLFPIGN